MDFESLAALDAEIKSFKVGPNPYTWFTMEALEDTWRNLQKIIAERDSELLKEAQRQEDNDRLRKEFARHANAFHQWLTETRYALFIFANPFKTTIIAQSYTGYWLVMVLHILIYYLRVGFRLRLLGWDG